MFTLWLILTPALFLGSPIAGAILAKPLKGQRLPIFGMMALLAFIGGAIGVFCSFNVRWHPSPTLIYLGFPFPAIIWQLEDGKWVDYVGSPSRPP